MDCTDIVIGMAKNQSSRILDYYTRDRSTPRVDSFYGGVNDLTATAGFEENGVTTIIFRRKLVSKDVSDHSFVNDLMHVIWARGQEPGNYMHVPPSGLEKESASVQDFYQPDELKYHGHKSQRGVTSINFFDEKKSHSAGNNATAADPGANVLDNDCEGHWKYPRTCQPEKFNCEYYASWQTIGNGDEFRFRIQTTNTKTWTGIGFSDNERMSQTDAVIGWVDQNGRPFVGDAWIVGYSSPKLDEDQHAIRNVSGRIQNGATILEFTRKRESKDEQDLSFTDDHCLYLMFPVLGGRFNAVNKKMSKHEQTPIVTDSRICIKSCGRELLENTILPDKGPSQLAYAVSVKLMNLAESFESPAKGTPEFDSLASQIANSMAGVLSHIPGYHETEVNGFEK